MRGIQVATIVAMLGLAGTAVAGHSGSAPIDPKSPDDQTFIVDTGGGLDTGCTFRSGSPLRINVPIERYVGETNSDGTLADPNGLVAAQVVAKTAKIRFPAYDVDDKASVPPPYQPEVDQVSFNGHPVRVLTGVNNGWIMQEFEVPIAWVKFSSERGARGSLPPAGSNEIRIDIDTANSAQLWCTAVDWVEISVKSMAPILLVHDIAAAPASWDQASQFLEDGNIPFEQDIQLGPNASVDANGRQLAGLVADVAKSFGAERVHLVAHGKGGLDAIRYLSAYYDPDLVEVLSLNTLSTPHHGSVQADLAIANRTLAAAESSDPDVEYFLNHDYWATGSASAPQRPGLDDLQTSTSALFRQANPLPGSVRLNTWGADADVDNNGIITIAESSPLIDSVPMFKVSIGTNLYRILRDVSSIAISVNLSNYFGLSTWAEVTPIPTTTPLDNDLWVTDRSSRHSQESSHAGPLDVNHLTITNGTTAAAVMARIRADFPTN